jgi:hypothetical protein
MPRRRIGRSRRRGAGLCTAYRSPSRISAISRASDGLRHPDVPIEYRKPHLHRCGPAQGRGGGDTRQAATHRRSTRAAPSESPAARESVAAGSLVRRVLLRLRGRNGCRPLLRLAWQRHRRLDPLSVDCEWLRWTEADWGGSAAMASFRSPRRSITSASSRGVWKMRPRCWAQSPAETRMIPPVLGGRTRLSRGIGKGLRGTILGFDEQYRSAASIPRS